MMAMRLLSILAFYLPIGIVLGQDITLNELVNSVFTTTPKNSGRAPVTSGGAYKSCGDNKECVPRQLCADGALNTEDTISINIRINDDSPCTYCEICCDIPNKTKKSVIPPLPAIPHVGCGWRNENGVGFRINGYKNNEAQFGEFPWMVAIFRSENAYGEQNNMYDCGGSLIAPNVVLTASHCVSNREANQLVVRGGEWDTQNTNEILPHVDKRVREIITHEKYNKGALYNDVALLILDEPFHWKENIRPICLPEHTANFDHSRCYATGWGKDKFIREETYQVILKKIDLPVVPNPTCQNYLRQTRLGLYFNLHESFICAGGEKGQDTCEGDGGSPLVCPIPGQINRYYQAGIVAWGIGCAEENVPGVYANVAHLRPWISDKLNARGINFVDFTP